MERQLAAVMFTDIEGFTALMQTDEALALSKRERYTRVVEEQHKAFGGTIVQYFGDGSLSTFGNSVDAVACAVAIQKEFQSPIEVPVRIGIHVGNVMADPTGLVGDAVNIASRIESFGYPSAVMISDSVHDQVKNQAEFDFLDLGKFRLKNVGRPFSIYAVATPGLAVPRPDFLRGKGEHLASLPANLPDPLSPLLGRDADLAALAELLAQHRVLTLTGPGGIGKTRTAIELCHNSTQEFLDGISFVALSDVADPEEVIPTVADALDVKEAEGRSLAQGVAALVGDKKALLLLDNLEQVVDAAPAIAELADACPELRMVVTSRTPLRIMAEHEYALSPLALPPAGGSGLDDVSNYSSVALFTERARAANSDFELNADNHQTVAELCRRMDGLPLAIELAAARIRILDPDALLARLEHALEVLIGGRRDLPERQQTLRAAIDWSHSLLDDAEQKLLRRLAVFAGRATLDAVEAICAEPGVSILDELESLVDQAMVVAGDGSFSMLQTIREFATERLAEAGEVEATAWRHAAYYAGVATEIGVAIEGTDQLAAMELGVREEANITAAFNFLTDRTRDGDAEAAELGMSAHGDLWMYWHIRGKHVSAREFAERFLKGPTEPSRARARVLNTAGISSWTLRDYQRALEEWSESYRVAEEIGDRQTMGNAAVGLAVGHIGFDLDKALAWAATGTDLGRELDYPFHLSQVLAFDGILHAISGDADAAVVRLEEALSIQESRGDNEGAGIALGGLALLASMSGDHAKALDWYFRSRAAFEAVGDRAEEARVLGEMAWSHLANGDSTTARAVFLESAQAYEDVGSTPGVGTSMIGLAAVEATEGRPRQAVTISSAAQRFSEEEGIVNVYSEDSPGHPYLEEAKAHLSTEAITEAETEGRTLSVKQAVAMVKG